jgi:hypothetical protein
MTGRDSGERLPQPESQPLPISPTDVVLGLIGLTIAGPFCGAGAEAILHGEFFKAAAGFIIGVPLAVVAIAFPFLNRRKTLGRSAINRYAQWVLPLVFLGAVMVGPYLYRHWIERGAERLILSTPDNELQWRQREYVAALARTFEAYTDKSISIIATCYPDFKINQQHVRENVISDADAAEIVTNYKVYKPLRSAILTLIDYFEGISSSYQNGVIR